MERTKHKTDRQLLEEIHRSATYSIPVFLIFMFFAVLLTLFGLMLDIFPLK